jgi:hypothetical protein
VYLLPIYFKWSISEVYWSGNASELVTTGSDRLEYRPSHLLSRLTFFMFLLSSSRQMPG